MHPLECKDEYFLKLEILQIKCLAQILQLPLNFSYKRSFFVSIHGLPHKSRADARSSCGRRGACSEKKREHVRHALCLASIRYSFSSLPGSDPSRLSQSYSADA